MLNSKDTSGPAFPVKGFQTRAGQGFVNIEAQGMTLRDYFAAKAMHGILETAVEWLPTGKEPDLTSLEIFKDLANDAYTIADAMLKAREQ